MLHGHLATSVGSGQWSSAEVHVQKIPMPSYGRLPAGAHRELVEELHVLYESAGSPGLRFIDRKIKKNGQSEESVSHESVRVMLHGIGLAKWEKWDLVVRCLVSLAVSSELDPDAEAGRFQRLWTAANKAIGDSPQAPNGYPEQRPSSDEKSPFESTPADGAEEIAQELDESERFVTRIDIVDEAAIARAREIEIAQALARNNVRSSEVYPLIASTRSSARHNVILVSLFALFGALVGGMAGTIVATFNGAVGSPRLGAVIGPAVGLLVGMFAGMVIGSMSAGPGRHMAVGEGFLGLVLAGGLIGFFVGAIVSSQARAAWGSLLAGGGAGLAAGCVIGSTVILGLLIRGATTPPEGTKAGAEE